jgi:hypothetical protein
VGRLLCRSPLSVDSASQPPPAVASGETVTPALEPSCHKRARREEIGGDSGRIEDDHCSPRLELVASEARAEDPARPKAPVDAVPRPAATPEAGSPPAKETTPAGADTPPPPAIKDVTAGNDAAIHASSDPPSQEGTRETAAGATEKAPVPAAQTPSNLELVPSVQAAVPAAETRAGAAVGSPPLGLACNSGEPSQGLLATRVSRSDLGDDLPAPAAATRGA